MNSWKLVVTVALAGLSVGCAGSARYVTRNAADGVVGVPDGTNHWPYHYRDKAMAMIRDHVGPDFEIVKEEEVVTGQVVQNDQNIDTEQHPTIVPWMQNQSQRVQNTTTTRDVTEWRITYRKRTGPTVGALTGTAPMTLPPVPTP
jgi:hypothetical protein